MSLRVLFICVHNSARSQMAETFLNSLGEGEFAAESAGLEPTAINPLVVEVMAEEGFDLSGKQTRNVFDLFRSGRLFDMVVTVCDETSEGRCPIFPGVAHRLHLPFPDPGAATGTHAEKLAFTRKVRDAIKEKMRDLIAWQREGKSGRLGDSWEMR